MTLVGNDVVDLDEPAIATTHLRERFLARVLSTSERAALTGDDAERKVALWARFAAKEAAYKVLAKVGPAPPLAFARFEVAADFSSVRLGSDSLRLQVSRTEHFVHAIAWLGAAVPRGAVEPLRPGECPSEAVRARMLAELGGSGLSIVRAPAPERWDGAAPPRVLRHGVPLALDVSLSHDGRFIAWASAPSRAAGTVWPAGRAPDCVSPC